MVVGGQVRQQAGECLGARGGHPLCHGATGGSEVEGAGSAVGAGPADDETGVGQAVDESDDAGVGEPEHLAEPIQVRLLGKVVQRRQGGGRRD